MSELFIVVNLPGMDCLKQKIRWSTERTNQLKLRLDQLIKQWSVVLAKLQSDCFQQHGLIL